MRWSQTYIPTLREDPADAEATSHRLLVRAGFIRQLMAGHYTLLPLAVRVRAKIIDVIREEMNRIGAQEFILPAMHPAEIWRKTGRWEGMGEEIFATLALELRSYRDLPQRWYQFQTKFRDEPRPRSGLLRLREFTMKDSYSFDLDADGLDRSFALHYQAYTRIFARLGIPAIPVQASSGSMGGSGSIEFMCPSQAGEDLVVRCPSCGYAANVEKATASLPPTQDGPGLPAPERFPTPGARTIADLATDFDAPADRQIKTLVYILDGQLTLVLLRGDHALVEQKLADATDTTMLRAARADEILEALGASPGSLGAVGVTGWPVIADTALRGRRGMFTGANSDEVHLRGVDVDRDIKISKWADLREVTAGEQCPVCGQPLVTLRTIEVGHIFKLGYKYSDALNLSVLGRHGDKVRPIMGSYGIGVERAIAAVVECQHDAAGIVWPVQVAPFVVALVLLDPTDPETGRACQTISEQLTAAGIDAIVDDRNDRPGVKFRDVELVGIPYRLTIGARDLANGTVELAHRVSGNKEALPVETAADRILALVRAATA
jgi:prolyl-tRNA synthetase